MAGILQSVFSKGVYTLAVPKNVTKIKQLVNHSGLYFGLIVYTAIGAKVHICKSLIFKDGKPFFSLDFPASRTSCRVGQAGDQPGPAGHQEGPFYANCHQPDQQG